MLDIYFETENFGHAVEFTKIDNKKVHTFVSFGVKAYSLSGFEDESEMILLGNQDEVKKFLYYVGAEKAEVMFYCDNVTVVELNKNLSHLVKTDEHGNPEMVSIF